MPFSRARVAVPLLVASGLLVATPGCTKKAEGVQVTLEDVLVADVDAVVGFDVGALRKSPMAAPLGPMLSADPDLGPILSVTDDCNVNLDDMKITMGTTFESEGNKLILMIESPGVGKNDTLSCLEKKASAALGLGASNFHAETRGKVQVALDDDGGYTIVANENQVVLVTKEWSELVLSQVNGEAKPQPALVADALELSGKDADFYVALHSSPAIAGDLSDLPKADELSDLAIRVEASDKADAKVLFGYKSAEAANTAGEVIKALLAEAAPALGEVGMPASVGDSLKSSVDGQTVSAEVSLSAEAILPLTALAAG